MSGITSRTTFPLGGNVLVAADADLTADTSLTGAGIAVVGAAAALAADYTLSASPGQGHFGASALVAGTGCISDEGLAIRVGHANLDSEVVLEAAGGVIIDADSDLVFDLAVEAAGGLEYDAGTAPLVSDLDIDIINPGLLYDAGDVDMASELVMDNTVSPVFRLILPTGSAVFTGDRLWRRYPIQTGITMLVTDGAVTLKEYVSDKELNDADTYYLGGYRHQISPAERAVIVGAGYGDLIEEA